MALHQGGVDIAILALWLGHDSTASTQVYMHADIADKERALARLTSPDAPPGRYRPDDQLLAFLRSL